MTILAYNESGFNIGEAMRKRGQGVKGSRGIWKKEKSFFLSQLAPQTETDVSKRLPRCPKPHIWGNLMPFSMRGMMPLLRLRIIFRVSTYCFSS